MREAKKRLAARERERLLVRRGAVVVAERVAQPALEVARRVELLDDVRAADELALDENLRDRRPARELGQLLADLGVRQHVDRRDRRARLAERLERAHRIPAHDELRRSLHEDDDVLGLDDLLDLVAKLAHAVPLVVIRSSWMVPSASGSASAA